MDPSSTRPHIITSVPLVGRDDELGSILVILDSVASGRGQVVLVQGDAGIGKTRLAQEVMARARSRRLHAFLGRCFDQHTAVPYFPFAELLGSMLSDVPVERRTDFASLWPELAHIVPELGAPVDVNTGESQLQIFRAATGFVRAWSDLNPLVLVVEDLHWADSTSLALLLYIARHLQDAQVLVLATYRDFEVGHHAAFAATRRELIRERLAQEFDLEPLSEAGTAALVRSRLPNTSVSDRLIGEVHARAQGNPFFAEELLTAFNLKGEFKLPRSIQSVVRDRADRLPPDTQELLILASVLGQEFDLGLLVAASGRDEAEVLNALDAALELGLLQERQALNGERYGFAHALIQESLYEQIPGHRRRRLHLRVGTALETLHPRRVQSAAELSRHFLQGGATERARTYASHAGDDAASRYAHAEAAEQYRTALELFPENEDTSAAADIRRRLAGELHDLNELSDAETAYYGALRAFERLGDGPGQALVHWGLGRLLDSRYDMTAAAVHLTEALRLWPEDRGDAELARMLADATRALTFTGKRAAAIELAERGLALAERLDHPGLLARALLAVVTAHDHDIPDPALIDLLDRAEAIARGGGEWRTLGRIYSSRAVKRFHIGAVQGMLSDRRRSIEAAERSAETPRLAFAYGALANDCNQLGLWEEGRAAARAGLALDPGRQVSAYTTAADLAWMEGRHEDALALAQSLLGDARARGDGQGVADSLASIADLNLQLERVAEAAAPAREAVAVARAGWASELTNCLAVLSETLARLDAPDVQDVLAETERLTGSLGQEASRPQLLRAVGLRLLRQGDDADAIGALEASAAAARSQLAWIQLGRTLFVLAEAARERKDAQLTARADEERARVVERIGPEVRGLTWAQRLPGAKRAARPPLSSAHGEPAAPLSPREAEVATLIAQGLSDRQIAERLTITEGTAGVHVGHILTKLGFHARTEIASWAVRHALFRDSEPSHSPDG